MGGNVKGQAVVLTAPIIDHYTPDETRGVELFGRYGPPINEFDPREVGKLRTCPFDGFQVRIYRQFHDPPFGLDPEQGVGLDFQQYLHHLQMQRRLGGNLTLTGIPHLYQQHARHGIREHRFQIGGSGSERLFARIVP